MIHIENKATNELSKEELEGILKGFNIEFGLERSLQVMINQYTQNVFGYSFHTIAYDNEKIIGHVAAVPSYYWVDGQRKVITIGVDIFILKNYRDGEIFLELLFSHFDSVKKNGSILYMGFPDRKVMTIWNKAKLYKKIGEMDTYILPYRIGGVKPTLRFLNFLSKTFAWSYVYFTGLFASKKETTFKIEKDAESYNATRYKRMDGDYQIVRDGDLEFFYKCMSFKGVRAAFLIDVTGKSAKHFNLAVKYILKHDSKNFDVILYVGNLYFSNSGLIKVPRRFAPKQFNFIIRFFDKSFDNDMVKDIRNWDVNLATYDVI